MPKQEQDSTMNITDPSTKDKEVSGSRESKAVSKSEKQLGDHYEFLYWK